MANFVDNLVLGLHVSDEPAQRMWVWNRAGISGWTRQPILRKCRRLLVNLWDSKVSPVLLAEFLASVDSIVAAREKVVRLPIRFFDREISRILRDCDCSVILVYAWGFDSSDVLERLSMVANERLRLEFCLYPWNLESLEPFLAKGGLSHFKRVILTLDSSAAWAQEHLNLLEHELKFVVRNQSIVLDNKLEPWFSMINQAGQLGHLPRQKDLVVWARPDGTMSTAVDMTGYPLGMSSSIRRKVGMDDSRVDTVDFTRSSVHSLLCSSCYLSRICVNTDAHAEHLASVELGVWCRFQKIILSLFLQEVGFETLTNGIAPESSEGDVILCDSQFSFYKVPKARLASAKRSGVATFDREGNLYRLSPELVSKYHILATSSDGTSADEVVPVMPVQRLSTSESSILVLDAWSTKSSDRFSISMTG